MKTNHKIFITKILSIFTAGLLLFGCSLDETIYDTPVPDQVLTKESDVPVVLYGLYGSMTLSFQNTAIYVPLRSGMELTAGASVSPEISFSYDAANNNILQVYMTAYKVINNVNSFLENIERINFVSPATKERYIGEARFLRSFSYFNLVRFYGKLSIVLKATKAGDDYSCPRSSVDSVYTVIFNDFKKASISCPTVSVMSSAERGRVTKGAAQALLSEAYLTYANYLDLHQRAGEAPNYYSLAKVYADSVIAQTGYSLIPKYGDLFDNTKEADAYKEVIFGLQFTVDNAAGTLSNGSPFASYFAPVNMFKVCGNLASDGTSSGNFGIAPWVYDKYTTGDYKGTDGTLDFRMGNTMVPTRYKDDKASRSTGIYKEMTTYPQVTDVNANQFFPCCMKYVDSRGIDVGNNGNDYFYIRLAEMYLIKAEAINETEGPTQEAIDAVNKVRARARASATPASLVPKNLVMSDVPSKEDFRMKIYDERIVELYAEGRNFFDVRRMRYKDNRRTMLQYIIEDVYPSLKVNGAYVKLAFNATTGKWDGSHVNILQVPAGWNEKWLLWPIPANEYLLNTAIKGDYNPGWN